MKSKGAVSLMTAAAMLVAACPAFADISINSETQQLGKTVLINDRTYVGAERLMEAIGAEYSVDGDELTAHKFGISATATLKSIDGESYAPLRKMAEGLGGSVYWNAENGDINVRLALTDEGVLDKCYYGVSNSQRSLAIVDGGLVLTDEAEDEARSWMLTKRSDGYYTLVNRSNGNSPDVPGGSTDAGKALIQYAFNNNNNQHFAIEKNEDGSFFIKVKHSALYLTAKGNAVTQEEFTGGEDQRFELEFLGKEEKPVRVIDTSIKKKEKTPLDEHHYYSADGLGDKVRIVWKPAGLVDIVGDETISDVMLSWNGEGYDLLDKLTGQSVGSYDFVEVGELEAASYEKAPLHKTFQTIAKDGKKLAAGEGGLGFVDGETSDEAVWQLIAKGDGAYSVTNKADGKAIDVPNESKEPEVELITYTAGGGDNQQFVFEKNADGSYSLKAKHSELYLAEKDGKLVQSEKGDSFELGYEGDSDEMTMGVTAMPFLIEGEEFVTNMKIQWNDAGAERYNVYRSENGGEYEHIATLEGLSTDDYDLKLGANYTYRVDAISGEYLVDSAVSESKRTYQLPDAELLEFSNLKMSSLDRPNSLTDGETYFRFSHKGRSGGGFGALVLSTSTDDVHYGNETEVLTFDDIVNSPSASDTKIESIGFESVAYAYNKETGMLYMWCHMEANGGYSYARVAVAYGKPGEKFKFKCMRPMGDDSRDMGLYIDDDNSAYIICAIHGNANLAIYSLNEDWTDVEERIIVNRGNHRELPRIVKQDGIYYLFHSGTAGWYPTQCGYNVATDMKGPWSGIRSIGNTNTFSCQSGEVNHLVSGGESIYMLPYRWMWYWKDATVRGTQNRLMPISLSNGYAFFDFYSNFYYNLELDLLVPIQKGRLLSQGKPITATNRNEWASDANDGNYKTEWVAENEWPQSVSINLEQVYELSEMQISWRSWNSKETYYSYTVEASLDGETWTTILDRSEGYTDYAFTVDELCGRAQYVRVNILDTTPRNEEKEAYTPNMYEIRVFGY